LFRLDQTLCIFEQDRRLSVMILPPFFHFPHSHDLTCPQFPRHLPTCTHHVPPNHGTYLCLHCTHMHYPPCPCPYLVPYSCAIASYHISLTCSSMTHSSPFSTIHLPHSAHFLIPVYITATLRFTFIRGLMLLSLIL
jgi:hypothetical protein